MTHLPTVVLSWLFILHTYSHHLHLGCHSILALSVPPFNFLWSLPSFRITSSASTTTINNNMPRSANEPGNARKWDEKYDELKQFKEKHGHCKVPQNEANGALGKWVKLQRKKRAQGKMPDERVTRLEAIGFAWSGNVVPRKADQWQEKFEMLKRLMSERGAEHSQALPSISKENPGLATWIAEQRKAFKAGTLDDASTRKLDEINFVWKVDPLWNRYFKALEAAVTKYGTMPAAQQALEAAAAVTSSTAMTEQADAAPVAAAKEGDGSTAPAPAPEPAAAAGGLLTTVKNMFSTPAAAEEGTSEAAAAAGQDTKVAADELALKPFNPTDAELLEWIAEQKSIPNIASKTVSVEQVEMLQGLPGWTWEEHSWSIFFVQLKGFKRKRGHCRVSTKSGGALGQWVARQRYLYASTKEDGESTKAAAPTGADAASKPAAAPGVEAVEADDEENNLPRLQVPDIPAEGEHPELPVKAEAAFAAGAPAPIINGQQMMIPPQQGPGEVALGDQSSLSTTQIEALNAIGFIWKPVDGHATWNDMYQQLKEYKEEHGHCMVPKRNKKDPRLAKLGVWVGKQRERHKNMLAAKTGETGQQLASAPAKAEGDAAIPAAAAAVDAAEGGPKKKVFHRPPLQQDQVDLLTELGFVWEAGAKSDHAKKEWDAKLEELIQFEKKEGHANVSAKLKGTAGQLGRWIKTQRERYHGTKKKLTPLKDEQIAQLEAVPGFSWRPSNHGPPDESWGIMFQEMIKYKEQHGDCLVPQKHGKLGGWVDRQRKRYKATQSDKEPTAKTAVKHLSAEQIEQLNGIGFVWQAKPTPKRKYDAQAPTMDDNSNPSKKT
mmetsp:Transcript_43084/g.104244  ORF Transcript_43084/g.104244 Transcript_43084/m.104244 type:complete len:833 (+) Transcript_43084:318-2816(+)